MAGQRSEAIAIFSFAHLLASRQPAAAGLVRHSSAEGMSRYFQRSYGFY